MTLATTNLRADTSADPASPHEPVKITDAKLSTVNYGLETIEYWLTRMKPGDKTMTARIDRDLLKTIERFRRVKGADKTQSDSITKRIQQAAAALQAKSTATDSSNKTSDEKAQDTGAKTGMSQAEASELVSRLQKKYHQEMPVPKLAYKNELKPEAVDNFVRDIKRLREEVAKDLPLVRELAANHRQARYLLNLLETETEANIKKHIDSGTRRVDGQVKFVASFLSNQAKLDPKQNGYAFNNEANRIKNEEQFTRTARTIEQMVRLQSALGLAESFTATEQQFDRDLTAWRGKFAKAIAGRKLPKDIGDKQLRKMAEEVLRKEKYGIGKIEKLIVNAKKRPGERIEHKPFAGKLETIIRVWEEYQVATVEFENGKYFLYFNTLKKFSRAPRTTPINEWILSKRIKSGEVTGDQLQ